ASATSWRTSSRPIPLPPPVTTAVLPANSVMCVLPCVLAPIQMWPSNLLSAGAGGIVISGSSDEFYDLTARGGSGEWVIRLRRRDQQGGTHIPTGCSASSTDAFPRKVDRFSQRFAILLSKR